MSLDQWLIRSSDNKITGPFAREDVVRQIRDGLLGPQDEVCQANRYWFFLHESREVQLHLGVQLPRSAQNVQGVEEEITETQTEVPIGDGATSVSTLRKRPVPAPTSSAPVQLGAVNRYPGIPQSRPQAIEKPSLWRGFAWILVIAAGAVIYSVLKILR